MYDHHSESRGSDQIRTLFTLVRQQDGITRQQLSDRLQIPATTLNRLINRLMNAGLILEAGLADSSGGRRPGLYSIAGTPFRLLGLDISAAYSRLVMINLQLEVLDYIQLPGLADVAEAELSEKMTDAVTQLLDRQSVRSDDILGMGIGWAAASDQETEMKADDCPAYVWDLRQQIMARWNFPVAALRGADAALYAGLWLDRTLSDRHLLYFSVGRTIRAGMVWQGQFHQTGLATDQVNRLIINGDRQKSMAELGQIATHPAMLARYRQLKKDDTVSWQDLCSAAAKGKKKAIQVMQPAARSVAVSIYNAALITGTDVVLFGGPVVNESPEFEVMLRGELADLIRPNDTLHLLDQPYQDRLIAVGAAACALEQILDQRLETGA